MASCNCYGCTGSCRGNCYGSCSGCGGGCSSGCSGCRNGCTTACTGCWNACAVSCGTGCGGGCTSCSGCTGSCKGKCAGGCTSCTGSCSGSCSNTCSGSCSGGCSSCSGGCTSCYGCTSCTGCTGSCAGQCSTGCKGLCKNSCSHLCNKTCTNTAQTSNIAAMNSHFPAEVHAEIDSNAINAITTVITYEMISRGRVGTTAPKVPTDMQGKTITASDYNELANKVAKTAVHASDMTLRNALAELKDGSVALYNATVPVATTGPLYGR